MPIIEVKTRLRVATLLLNHAKNHLDRLQLILKTTPSCFELKCRTFSLLSQCYHLVGAIPPQKNILFKALELTASASQEVVVKLWSCNFNSQLANVLIIEGDCPSSISALQAGCVSATEISYPDLQMFFATSILHVRLMQREDENLIGQAINQCNVIWESIDPNRRGQLLGLLFYNELLYMFYRLRICDNKNAAQHVDKLDAAMKVDLHKMQQVQQLTSELNALSQSLSRPDLPCRERSALSGRQAQLQEQLKRMTELSFTSKYSLEPAYFGNERLVLRDKLFLAPPPIDGEWLPKSSVYVLVDLMAVIFGHPKDFLRTVQSGFNLECKSSKMN